KKRQPYWPNRPARRRTLKQYEKSAGPLLKDKGTAAFPRMQPGNFRHVQEGNPCFSPVPMHPPKTSYSRFLAILLLFLLSRIGFGQAAPEYLIRDGGRTSA